MNTQIVILIVLLSICQGLYCYTTTLAYFWREYPSLQWMDGRQGDCYGIAIQMGVAGLIPLIGIAGPFMILFLSEFNKHGVLYRLPREEE